jgi:hypothetical protein
LKRHSHSAGLVDFFITLAYSTRGGKVIGKSNRPALWLWHYKRLTKPLLKVQHRTDSIPLCTKSRDHLRIGSIGTWATLPNYRTSSPLRMTETIFIKKLTMESSCGNYSSYLFYHNLPILWQYGLLIFQVGVTKLEKKMPKNQHTQRKWLNSENWWSGELSKIRHHCRK